MQSVTERRRMRGQGGFTLIELLVVIAILGVLAGVVVFAVGGIQDDSDQTACKIDGRTVKTAVQAFRAQERKYPNAADDLADGVGAVDGSTTPTKNGDFFIPGLLDKASDNVTTTYGATGTVKPTYVWAAGSKCADLATAGDIPAAP